MTKCLVRFCLPAAMLVWASFTQAGDLKIATIPPGDDNIVSVKKGESAPFNGQLFDTDTAIRWGLWLQQYQALTDLELQRANAVCKAELNYKQTISDIDSEKSALLNHDLVERLKRSEEGRLQAQAALSNPPFYRSATFQFSLGVLSTVAVVLIANKAF